MSKVEMMKRRKKMANLDEIKSVIRAYYPKASHGIFDTRNIVGDSLQTVFNKDGVQIDVCYGWEYFEIFGLNPEQFSEVEKYYYELRG